MLRGQGICHELLAPKLAVVDDRIVLTSSKENVLGRRSDVSTSSVAPFPPLYERLSGYRTHFKAVRAEAFEPTLHVTFDPALEPARAASLLSAAAQAGYARMRIAAGSGDVALEWWVPRSEREPARAALCVEPAGAGFTIRLDPAPPDVSPIASGSLDALAADLGALCQGRAPCAEVLAIAERDGATFGELARMTAAALGAAPFKAQRPRVLFVTKAPGEGKLAKRPCG